MTQFFHAVFFSTQRAITFLTTVFALVIFSRSHAQQVMAKGNRDADRIEIYQPPQFTDTGRLIKILAALPVIERVYKEHAASNNFPGFAFGVVADGKLIYSGCTGYADINKKTGATQETMFRVASMTKSFTALAIIQLRDEGKLGLDDPISKYIPKAKKMSYLTLDSPPITVRHLLTHSAGFPEDNPWGDRQLADSNAELIQLIEQGVSFSTAPGLTYEYSNLGFTLLGNIVSRVSGRPYQEYITDKILKPLGMKNTLWEYDKVPAEKLAHGYRRQSSQWKEEPLLHDGAYGAMGGLISTIEDLARYMSLFLSSWPPGNGTDNVVIKRSSLREMQQLWKISTLDGNYRYPGGRACPLVSGYGYGLRWARDCDGRTTIGHSGGLPGFGSNWTILPDYGIGVICLSNLTYGSTSTLNTKILDTLITLAALKPRQLPPSAILKQRTAELIRILPDWNNAQSSGIFAENFFPDNLPDSLQAQSKYIFTRAGKINRVRDIIPENQLRGTFVMEGEKANVEVFFTLTPENPPLIQQLRVREMPLAGQKQ